MKFLICMPLLIIILFFSCKNRDASQIRDWKTSETSDSIAKSSPTKARLKVSAYLIYNDGSLSSFDVLNDKTVALWNAIAGGGDVLKPSENTKVILTGRLDSLDIKIKNGGKLVIDTSIVHSDKSIDYTIKNTGCEEVYVSIAQNRKLVYNDTIPFHCGE